MKLSSFAESRDIQIPQKNSKRMERLEKNASLWRGDSCWHNEFMFPKRDRVEQKGSPRDVIH